MNDILIWCEEKIASFFMGSIILLVFIAGMLRCVGHPVSWSVDMAQLLFVWASFLGADLALRSERHIGVDIVVRALPQKIKKIITFCSYILISVFLLFVIVYGISLSMENYLRRFNGMNLSFAWATMSAPIGCALMLSTMIGKIIRLTKGGQTVSDLSTKTVQQL
jgi:TRAP-type C4-dicarboxylate transport system permease small subunit